jgi:metal-responsive CopG/Arc/MetJ family transcriptional regulator
MQRTNIYLDDRQIELLDHLAAAEGVSRAEVIRRLVDRALVGSDETVAADLHAIDLSFGAMANVEYDDRGPGDRESHLARMWQLRP